MGKRLTIDCGNTSTKVAVWDGNDDFSGEDIISSGLLVMLDKLYRKHGRFEAAIVSSVIDPEPGLHETLAAISDKVINLGPNTPQPLAINYSTPMTLGSDRIAAAVAASRLFPGQWILVVDIGTAVTYDVVSPENVFVGGNIAPGIKMRAKALSDYTSRLPMINLTGDCPDFGDSTETALRAGVIRGVVAEIMYYSSLLPRQRKVIITGGRSSLVTPFLNPDFIIYPQLVTKGLNTIITYNENN